MPGRRGSQQTLSKTSLNEVLPIIYDIDKPRGLGTQNSASYMLTERGREHWLTKLRGTGKKIVIFGRNCQAFIGLQQLAKLDLVQKYWQSIPIM